MSEILIRRIPRHEWIRIGVTTSSEFERGHDWTYHGIIHRDAWKLGPLGIYLLRMPKVPQPTVPSPGSTGMDAFPVALAREESSRANEDSER